MDSFVNPNDQDATRSKTSVNMKDLDSEDLDEDNEMEELLKLAGQQNKSTKHKMLILANKH